MHQCLAEVEQEQLLQQPAPLVAGDLEERLPVTSLVELSSWSNYDVRVPYQRICEDHCRTGALSSALVWLRSLRLMLKGRGVEQLQDWDRSSLT